MSKVIRSVSYDQKEIIEDIMKLNGIDRFDADLTYGNGVFWKDLPRPFFCFDIDESLDGVVHASSTNLPVLDNSFKSVMFDPPFLTYVRENRFGNGEMIMAKRFAGYWTYKELEDHYRNTIIESHRILNHKGILVFKCQDIIHNHKLHCTHMNVVNWSEGLFRLKDLFILPAKHRLPSPNRVGTQRHARIFHSYFLVLEANKK